MGEKERKREVRAAFDFETWGWTPEEGESEVKVNALCCAFVIPKEDEEGNVTWHPYYLEDETHVPGTRQASQPNETVEKALRFMWAHSEVDSWWAHFSHAFDTLHLCAAAYRLDWRVRASIAGQGPIAVELSPPGETRWLQIRDLFRILSMKLSDIAESFQLPSRKLFQKTDYEGDMRDLARTKLKAGCVTDCLLVLEALESVETMLTQFGGQLKTTFSASALTVVKASLKERGVKLPQMRHSRACQRDEEGCACYHAANVLARAGYYGARVEVFTHLPQHALVEFDVSSSYPWSMSQTMPVRWSGNVTGKVAVRAFESGVEGIYEADVTVPKSHHLPPLPFKLPDGGLYFPTGSWRAFFPANELRYARGLGVKIRIRQGVTYEIGEPFKSYVHQLYELKKAAPNPSALREFLKFLLNGSYGKFAERPERERLFFIPDALEAMHLQWEEDDIRPLDPDGDPRFLAQSSLRYARHAHYAIGAYVTAYSRILIHQRMREAHGLAYVDTDSLHCRAWDGSAGSELGQLKLELEHFWGRFYAPKLYSLHGPDGQYLRDGRGRLRVACKGFQKGEPEDFEAVLDSAATFHALIASGASQALAKEGARGVGQELVRTRLLRSQLRPKEDASAVFRRVVRKSWSGLSKKRCPLDRSPSGETRPWGVAELAEGKHLSALCPLLGM